MNRILFIFLFLFDPSVADWKNVFQSKPLHDLSPQCLNDTNTWIQSLEKVAIVSMECLVMKKCSLKELKLLEANLYAIEQLDAFGQFPSPGLFQIKTLYDGSYTECQRISGQKYETNYCYMLIRPGKNANCSATDIFSEYPFRLAVCLPYSCNHTDMINVFNQLTLYPFTACHVYCAKYEVEKDSSFWGYSIFLWVICGIAISATFLDFIRESTYGKTSFSEKNVFLKIILSFSLWTNVELLLSVKEHKPGFIKSLDCLRAFSIFWVINAHSFQYSALGDTLRGVRDFPKHLWNHVWLNADVSVDTFFIMSGMVVTYLFFKMKLTKKMIANPVTWILFYVHRYLRLTPPVMFFIGFFTVYAPYIQGAFSASELNALSAQANACRTYWWQNLLYINNFDSSAGTDLDTCYGITWYLAVDTQLYLIAPIVLVALYFSFALGTFLIVAGCVGSIITTYILYGKYDIQGDMFGNGNPDNNFFDLMYDKPWIRCPTYLIGMLNGYLLATYGSRKIRLNWALALIGWIVAFTVAGLCLSATYDYDEGSYWSTFTRATYYTFHRIGWAFFICWVVSANHMGWGGPINNFMSHPIWQPLGRLSYCFYIIHLMVLYYFMNVGGPLQNTTSWRVFLYIVIPATVLSFVFAFFWSCLFEVPFLKLEKLLIESLVRRPKRESEVPKTWEIKTKL